MNARHDTSLSRRILAGAVRKLLHLAIVLAVFGTLLVAFLALTPREFRVRGEAKSVAMQALRIIDDNGIFVGPGEPVPMHSLFEEAHKRELRRYCSTTSPIDYFVLVNEYGNVAVLVEGSFIGATPTWIFWRDENGVLREHTIYWYQSRRSKVR